MRKKNRFIVTSLRKLWRKAGVWQLKYVLDLTDHWLEIFNLDLFSQNFSKYI